MDLPPRARPRLPQGDREKSVSLHSRYNPQAEADRYINSLSLNESIRFFILIEPGLGYMAAPLKKRAPDAKIIALHAGEVPFLSNEGIRAPDSEWRPGTGIPVQDFLDREIPDSPAREIRIIEWRPALAVYGNSYLALVEEAVEFVKRSDANVRTLEAFGRKWFRNFFRNIGLIKRVLCPEPLSLPLVITGAGPGLEKALPLIMEEERKGGLYVLSVSSSSEALEAADLIPAMVISTDGGSWAKYHLYQCFRGNYAKRQVPLAAALYAALPSQSGNLPILPISDRSLWQSLVLKELKIPFIALPQRGTVSAAALDLAFFLTSGDVYIAGIDLENEDIRSHARPYSLDRFMDDNVSRLSPFYSQAYTRSSLLKAGGSFGIYASWFEKQLASYPGRLHSLGRNNRVFKALETSSFAKGLPVESGGRSRPLFKTLDLDSQDNASLKAVAVLEKALKDPLLSIKLREELEPLLFSGRPSPPPGEFAESLRPLAGL